MNGHSNFRSENCLPQDYIQITNLANETNTFRDTLHHDAIENQPCDENICKASLYRSNVVPAVHKRSKKDLVYQATDFIKQYFASLHNEDPSDHMSRLYNVMKSIDTTGTYDLTEEELIFGVKTAWRNAPRCIGRIQWNNIKVFDCRKVSTAKDMFKAICNHIEYATNGGNIRSTITVFPHLVGESHAFRVWNAHYIKYAGYRNPDGSVTGDPSTVEFTDGCLSMGWRGKGTQFDVLPLVLQANGDDPEFFDIPPELILEVTLKHPKYNWFEGLGLKWCGLPAVSCMSLDCGGLEFTAAPFNGWYMSSEIGRDLCDPNRYNKSKDIAKLMGLDTETYTSLWIDRAVIELNIAVLYSFQQEHVTITEHHSAAASFVYFMENEYKVRGGCPADWVWINPPLTASSTPVFHQEMLNYKLKPSFEYQEDPWRKHKWQKDQTSEQKRSEQELCSPSASLSVLFSTNLMREARSRRIQCTVLYATETGRSERFAIQLSKTLDAVFQARVICMDKYDISCLSDEVLLFVVTSTFGDGEPPTNGVKLVKSLDELLRQARSGAGRSLSHIRFSVFGLGSRAYPKFCATAHRVDTTLHGLGLKRIYQLGEGDQLHGQENSFDKWARGVFKESCGEMKMELQETDACPHSTIASKLRLISTAERVVEKNADKVCSALAKIHGQNVVQLKVTGNRNLQSSDSDRRTNLIQLSNDQQQKLFVHQPGDHIGILPTNDEARVQRIIDRVIFDKLSPDDVVTMEVISEKKWKADKRLPPTTIRIALTHFLDITTPVDQMVLEILSNLATDDGDKNKLRVLSHDIEKYEEWHTELYQPLDVVLEEFKSVNVPAALLLNQLPLLQPRYYSVSSSPLSHPDEIHLTVGVVEFNAGRQGKGPKRLGVCSSWLDSRKCGDKVPLFHREVPNFHMPEETSLPIILVGPGTGLAPYMGFVHQRKAETGEENGNVKECYGDLTLYFGCRRSDHDHIFKTEIQSLVDDEVISKFHLALSREPGVPKTYVQDLLLRDTTDIYRQIVEEDAHIYVCGDIIMASQVEKTIKLILCQVGKMSDIDADNYIQRLCNLDRYHKDIYGFTGFK